MPDNPSRIKIKRQVKGADMDDRLQINVRLTPELVEAIDRKRIELQPELGKILTRSDVVRHALDTYLLRRAKAGPQAKGPAARRSKARG